MYRLGSSGCETAEKRARTIARDKADAARADAHAKGEVGQLKAQVQALIELVGGLSAKIEQPKPARRRPRNR